MIGLFVVGYLNDKRSVENDRRQVRTRYLLEAFRTLEAASNRNPETESEKRMPLESALADVQLLGSPKQIRLAVQFANSLAETSGGDATALLESMREELRDELRLETAPKKLLIFRWKK